MIITADTDQHINKLYRKYLSLNQYEQWVLKLLAVIYRPVGVTKLNTLLSHIRREGYLVSDTRIKALSSEHKSKLTKKKLIHHNKEGLQINPLLSNRLTWECVNDNSYPQLVKSIEAIIPIRTANEWMRRNDDKLCLIRDIYFYQSSEDFESVMAFDKNPQTIDLSRNRVLYELNFLPFDLDNFLHLTDLTQYHSFAAWYTLNIYYGQNNDYLLSLIEVVCDKNPHNILLTNLRAELYLNALRLDDFKHTIPPDNKTCYGLQLNATFLLIQGQAKESEELFKEALNAKNKYARKKRQFLNGTFGLFYKLCLLILAGEKSNYYQVSDDQLTAEYKDKTTEPKVYDTLRLLFSLTESLSTGAPYDTNIYFDKTEVEHTPFLYHLHILLHLLGHTWCGEVIKTTMRSKLKSCNTFFSQCGMQILATLGEQILSSMPAQISSKKKNVKLDNNDRHDTDMVYFPDLVSRKAEWDLALEKLIALNPNSAPHSSEKKNKTENPSRLIWEMSFEQDNVNFKAREQKQTQKGWSKGRPVSLKRLSREPQSFNYLSDADKKMCDQISAYQSWDYYQSMEYRLEGTETLLAAKDIELLFLDGNLQHPIVLIQKEPELLVSEQGGALLLSIADLPSYFNEEENYTVRQSSPHSYTFTIFNNTHVEVAEIVGEGGLMIPAKAKAKVLESVSAIAPLLNIQSNIDELDTGLETINCDEHLVINIQPLGEGLEFTCMVMPFGSKGPAFKPMVGNIKITTELDDKRIATQRDLLHEQVLLDALDEHCPPFLTMPDNVLAIDEPQGALEALEQLEQIISKDPMPFLLRLRWPKGKKIHLSKTLKGEHLSLAVNKKSEWFDLSGELEINEDEVIKLQKLLDLVSASSGRFVQLDSGQILALSHDLRERLDSLNQATDGGKFHPLASMQISEATTGMRMKTIHAWDDQAKKMYESNDIVPSIPSTLQAQLRDYQQEGFDWMTRLAHWKAGACLADDMGLGKTLQALALLLSRAENGPSLVIAPTSVCFNWQQEALKFAPTLSIHIFSDYSNSEQRKQFLGSVTHFDCVIISYGLLQRESELLSQIQWHTIVADEAQALKNPLAKRTQAACALKGDFKIITTGTPIENNLTELWSLFRFITPGLLGSLKRFGERYALPIENVKEDKLAARKASLGLKTLIQPFILRRMKNQVLTELPSRTEINVHVELSPKEQDFYEALRRNALDNIASASKSANEGEQRIKMLAELIKLRQACCNPQLVMPETELPSAKLAALSELLDDLQKNNHKALIFSQFVGHLQLIKQHLDQRNISYQYLDGSTPQKLRQTRVNAFQSGEGDVFLISLKAGGSGLNLTAADYVIHMDPWWNPAVEEQASDRAHRMGQKRPVTIYRLIAKNTIEERIVALHQHKRDLADNLLAGNEQATKLSVDDVLNMLKDNF